MFTSCANVLGLLLLAGCAGFENPPAGRATLIRGARLFDGVAVVEGCDVLIVGERIAEVGPNLLRPGADEVDGSGKTLLPGLIDAHTHIREEGQLSRAAALGITTLIDMGCDSSVGRSLKAKLATPGGAPLADLRFAGNPVTAVNGYGTEKGVPVEPLRPGDDVAAFIDARIAEGSDHIKVILDDGRAFGRRIPTITRETMSAAIKAAHARGKVTVVHISTQRDAKWAVEAGIDGLAHLFGDSAPDADFADLVKRRGVFVIPTLHVGRQSPGYRFALDTIRQLRSLDVPILAGSDDPTSPTALRAEIRRLVVAGLTAVEALASATSVPARVFGLGDRGRIAPGFRADLLLVEGDATSDVTALRRVVRVWREGSPLPL